MAYITVVRTGEDIDVDFGVYGDGDHNPTEARYFNTDIIKIEKFSNHVAISMRSERIWYMVWEATGNYMIIDSIDGVAPTSNADLFTKLKGLR